MKKPIDAAYGGVKRCMALWESDTWPRDIGTCIPNPNPLNALCAFDVEYNNGMKERLVARGRDILASHLFLRCEDFFDEGFHAENRYIGDERLLATVVEALRTTLPIPSGEVKLLDKEKAREVLSTNGIAVTDLELDEKKSREIHERWMERWLADGTVIVPPMEKRMRATKWLYEWDLTGRETF